MKYNFYIILEKKKKMAEVQAKEKLRDLILAQPRYNFQHVWTLRTILIAMETNNQLLVIAKGLPDSVDIVHAIVAFNNNYVLKCKERKDNNFGETRFLLPFYKDHFRSMGHMHLKSVQDYDRTVAKYDMLSFYKEVITTEDLTKLLGDRPSSDLSVNYKW